MSSGLLLTAFLAMVLNLILLQELADEATEEVSGGHAGQGEGSLPGAKGKRCEGPAPHAPRSI